MTLIFTKIQSLALKSGLREAIAAGFPHCNLESIPLSLCFQRSGLGYRSAIALQLANQSNFSIPTLTNEWRLHLANLPCTAPSGAYWCYAATITDTGWLEFFLEPKSLARWLTLLVDQLWLQNRPLVIKNTPLPPPFSFQYLHARSLSLLKLAEQTYPQCQPQWSFEQSRFHYWEQNLLDAVVRWAIAVEAQDLSLRLLLKLELAFWEFHRHGAIFAVCCEQPLLGAHYLRWIWLVQQIFAVCLTKIYNVAAIAHL